MTEDDEKMTEDDCCWREDDEQKRAKGIRASSLEIRLGVPLRQISQNTDSFKISYR